MQFLKIDLRRRDGGFRLRQCDLIRLRINAEQYVANIHMLIFTDVDGDNPARHIAADSHLILLHVSIVSADISSACQPDIAAYDGPQQRSGEHTHPSAPRRGGWSVRSGSAPVTRGEGERGGE